MNLTIVEFKGTQVLVDKLYELAYESYHSGI